MYQQITLIGNLGQDPEMRYTPGGAPVTNFSVATKRAWTGEDGQRQERTVWFRVAAWQRLAETCNQYLAKGRRVLVVGEMEEPHAWTDESGSARASLKVRARHIQFLTSRAEAGEQSGGQPVYSEEGNAPSQDAGSDVDVPF